MKTNLIILAILVVLVLDNYLVSISFEFISEPSNIEVFIGIVLLLSVILFNVFVGKKLYKYLKPEVKKFRDNF